MLCPPVPAPELEVPAVAPSSEESPLPPQATGAKARESVKRREYGRGTKVCMILFFTTKTTSLVGIFPLEMDLGVMEM